MREIRFSDGTEFSWGCKPNSTLENKQSHEPVPAPPRFVLLFRAYVSPLLKVAIHNCSCVAMAGDMRPSTEASVDTVSASTALPATADGSETRYAESSSVPPSAVCKPDEFPKHELDWITGDNNSLIYVRRLGTGVASSVHEVTLLFIHANPHRSETFILERYPCQQRRIANNKVYARKVIHVNDHVSIQDVTAVIRVCHSNPEGNVVQVFNLGRLHYDQYYFFDMEICDFSLHDYIHHSWSPETAKNVPNFANREALGPFAKFIQICSIMIDIACGVAFIHGCGYIHRALSPRNGRYLVRQGC